MTAPRPNLRPFGLVRLATFLLIVLALPGHDALPQEQRAGTPEVRLIGNVTAVDAGTNEVTVRAEDGKTTTVRLEAAARCLLIRPGETDLNNARAISFTDIKVGDRVLARGKFPEEQQHLAANLLVVMSQTDLAKKQEQDLAEWKSRGMVGKVTAVDDSKKEISLQVQSLQENQTIILEAADQAHIRRYPPGSFRFADTQPSSFAAIKVGDQLQVLGEKSADGMRLRPEQIIAGSFRTLAVTVTAVDAGAGKITIKDLKTGEPATIQSTPHSVLRRLPPRMALLLGRMIRGTGAGEQEPARRRFQRFGGNRQGAMSLRQILERAPVFSLEELQTGEPLILSSTDGEDGVTSVAVIILAGVEPILAATPPGRDPLAGQWSLEINIVQ